MGDLQWDELEILKKMIQDGNLPETKRLILTLHKLDTGNGYKEIVTAEAFLETIKANQIKIFEYFIEEVDRLNLRYSDNKGRRAIHYAVEIRNIDMVKVLFRHGSAVSYSDNEGIKVIHIATKNGDTDMLNFLLKQGANPGSRIIKEGYTPLHIAALSNQPETLKILADNVTSLNPQTKHNFDALTPLHIAVKSGHEEIVKILCDRGACLDMADMEGRTPLHFAADKGRYDILKILLQHGSSLNIKDKCGKQVLHYAVFSKSAACVQLLIDQGAKVDAADLSGHTPLVGAVIVGVSNIVDILIKHGANVNVLEHIEPTQETPLLLASAAGNVRIIQKLLDAGANVLAHNRYGETVLHKCQRIPCDKRDDVVHALIKGGAELNTLDKNGFTPLHKLTFQTTTDNFSMSTLKILVEHGVYLASTRRSAMSGGSIVGESRQSALCWLVWRGYYEAAAYLVRSGWNLYPETWMYLPGPTSEQNSFHQWMIDFCKTTPSLMQLCRSVIRKQLCKCTAGCEIMTSMSHLELPRTLTEYLMLKN